MITYHDSGNLSAVGGRFCATANATESIHVQNWNLTSVGARLHKPAYDGPGCGAGGPSSTTTILGRFPPKPPSETRMRHCMLNRQRELTLPHPTAAPTANSSACV